MAHWFGKRTVNATELHLCVRGGRGDANVSVNASSGDESFANA